MTSKSILFVFITLFLLTLRSKTESVSDCRNSIFGCCPDGVTPAEGQNYDNCLQKFEIEEDDESCQNSEFGCCSDNYTAARGPNQEGCSEQSCQNSLFGCCPDLITPAKTEDHSDCPETSRLDVKIRNYSLKSCSLSEFECCPDGLTPANGPNFKDCSEDGSVILIKNLKVDKNICVLPQPENSCYDYSIKWRFDINDGRCVQFWFGGCNGNENLFNTSIECEARCVNPNGTDICELPLVNPKSSESQMCHQNVTRYYYDINTSSCRSFSYSGCNGNANNFESIEECERRCQIPLLFEKCSFIPDKGPCRGDHERWYYDSKIGECKTFSYGGCMINKNNHLTESDCFNSCVKPKQKSVCLLPKMIGNCDQKINSWYYDFIDGKCKQMMYSGCNGNLNRFETQEACEYTCQGLVDYPQPKIVSDICDAPKVSGTCHLNLQRYYYNSTTKMCHQFSYTGCDGSPNNFETEIDCRTICNAKKIDPCELPMDVGSCDDYKIFWYFNNIDRECSRFYYGGCEGNANRFVSKETCEMDCKMTPEEKAALLKLPKKCLEPMDYGSNCNDLTPKWYFDTQSKECYPFEYSGCGPDFSNRFDSNEECNKTCVESLNPDLDSEEIKTSTSIISSNKHEDICSLPAAEGNCTQKSAKWYYDTKLKYCTQFNFTGCNGNENRFENRKQCSEICEIPKKREICYSNKAQGPCDQFQLRWYYDHETKSCQEFHYGGCLGNDNNFHSSFECKNFCWEYLSEESKQNSHVESTGSIQTHSTTKNSIVNAYDICSLEKSEGNCFNETDRWYYDATVKECKKFIYNGCDGNENNFETKEKCLSKCSSGFLNTGSGDYDNICEAPVDISTECLDSYTGEILLNRLNSYDSVWFYDLEERICRSISKECLSLNNQNRFKALEDCKSQCIPNISDKQNEADCLLPFDTGDKCSLQIWRWYYDSNNGQCHLFSYSGCHGNNNNFPSYKDCMWLCAAVGDSCPSIKDCDLNCSYGRVITKNKCELCECIDPCEKYKCEPDHKCVVKDSLPICRQKNKPGVCPQPLLHKTLDCNNNCLTDADCDSDQKCCMNGCSSLQCTKPNFDKEPVIEEFKIHAVVNEGDTLELPCKASGYPKPTITWFKRIEEIVFDNRIMLSKDNSLIIKNISDKDEAVYSCHASNGKGKSVVKESNVVVNADAQISHGSYEKWVLIGNDAILNCNLSGRPYPKSQWFFNGSQIPIKPDPFKYTIYPNMILIKRFNKNDIGIYTCKLDKVSKKISMINVSLHEAIPGEVKFIFNQTIGDENSSVSLKCEVNGEPTPIVIWQNQFYKQILNNTKKYEFINDTYLKINSLSQSDNGIYRCYAYNQFSSSSMRKKFGSVLLNVYSQPIIKNKPEFKQENISGEVMFNCFSAGNPKPEINWYQDDKLIVLNSTIDPKHSAKFSYFQNGSLLIKNLEASDSGNYYCQAINLERYQSAILNHTLNVILNKLEVVQSYNINAYETETVKLNCQLESKEKIIAIKWTLNDNRKFNSNNFNPNLNNNMTLLTIKNAKISDSGLYICSSETESTFYTTRINVKISLREAKNVEIESKTKSIKTTVNESVSLDCAWWYTNSENLFDSSSEYTIEWKLNSSVLENDQKYEFLDNYKTLLDIKNIQLLDSYDTYSCILKMSDYTEKQSVFKLIVGIPPKFMLSTNKITKWVQKLDKLVLDCPFNGLPKPSINWYHNYNEISFKNYKIDYDSLTIYEVDDEQKGIYTCNATNEFGTDLVDFTVELARPIRVKEIGQRIVKVDKYETASLKCDYNGGRPEPSVKWFLNGTKIDLKFNKYVAESNKLLIKNVSDIDNGLYMCILSNGFFQDRTLLINLRVIERLSVKFFPENPLFIVGTEGKISCLIENSYVTTQLNWSRNNHILENSEKYSINGNNLIVKDINSSDSGKYYCSVGSGDNQVRKSVDVKVIDRNLKIECEDKSSYNNCKLVVSRGLCSKYGKYCCKTCKQAGFDSKLN